jgi:hypothetical protein
MCHELTAGLGHTLSFLPAVAAPCIALQAVIIETLGHTAGSAEATTLAACPMTTSHHLA